MTDKRLIFYGPPGHLPRLHIFQWTLSIPYNFSDCHQILRVYLKYPVPLALAKHLLTTVSNSQKLAQQGPEAIAFDPAVLDRLFFN